MKKEISPTTSWKGLLYPLLTYDKLGIKARIICYVDTDRGDGSEIYTRHGSYSRKIYIMRLLVIA